jgi:hypothetical protein
MRSILVLALMFTPGLALAGEVMSTAPTAQPAPAAAPVAPLRIEDDGDPNGGGRVAMGPCGPEAVSDDGKVATKAHGYVEAGVGTSGYRHLAGGVCKPLANGGAVSVSVSETQGQGRRYGW